MGYRSDVAFRISFDDEQITAEMIKNSFRNFLIESHEDEIVDSCDITEMDGSVTFAWFNVKWYDSYSDVRAIEQYFEKVIDYINDYEDGHGDMGFRGLQKIEIGEDYDDVTDSCYGDIYNYMCVRREIEF